MNSLRGDTPPPPPPRFGDTVSVTIGFIGFSWNAVLEFFTKSCLANVRCDNNHTFFKGVNIFLPLMSMHTD